ncbi:MAG: hypothetical protein O7G85_15155, partial [Planctomycetota bacterium]|nr:hypothetical protein [Planctomycetota bacterium]
DFEVWANLKTELKARGSVRLTDLNSVYVIESDTLKQGRFSSRQNRLVKITKYVQDRAVREFTCREVTMLSNQSDSLRDRSFDVLLTDVTVRDLSASDVASNRRQQVSLNNLVPEQLPDIDLTQLSVAEVLERADRVKQGEPNIRKMARKLDEKMIDLQWEVTARLLKRYSLSATAMLLILLGSVLAIWMKHTPPLTVYLLAFFPSILDLILISGGEQMMRDGSMMVGGMVMWSGNAVLLVAAGLAYFRLSRN